MARRVRSYDDLHAEFSADAEYAELNSRILGMSPSKIKSEIRNFYKKHGDEKYSW